MWRCHSRVSSSLSQHPDPCLEMGRKKTTPPCPQPQGEMSEISQALSSQSTLALWAQSQAGAPCCCLLFPLPRCEWALAQACPRRGRQGIVLPKFRPTQHFPLLFRFVSLVSLYFFFSILFDFLWRRDGWTCYEFSEVKQLTIDDSRTSVCAGIPEWPINRVFLKINFWSRP